ncbi:MAG TPA: hypothetical protein VGB17_13595 [Pyrinomonadaceae bacterium]|jgi:hypothetical protein
MSEVTEFLRANPDMGPEFQEFATRYSSLAEVWENCPRSDWMLWILGKRTYPNAEQLEKCIAWLRDQVEEHSKNKMEMRLKATDARIGWSLEQIKEDLEAKKITEAEATHRRFISTLSMAINISKFVLDEKVTDTKLNNLYLKNAPEGKGMHIPNMDEIEIKSAGSKEQAEQLRQLLGNPFLA